MNPPVNQHFTFDENLSTEFTFVWNLFLFGAAFCTPRGYVSRSGKKRDGNINSSSFEYVCSNLSLGCNWDYNSYPSTMYSNCPKEIPDWALLNPVSFAQQTVTTKRQTHVVSHITISQPCAKAFFHIIFLLKLTAKILYFSIFNTVLLKSEAP